jgi:hypothetical protein
MEIIADVVEALTGLDAVAEAGAVHGRVALRLVTGDAVELAVTSVSTATSSTVRRVAADAATNGDWMPFVVAERIPAPVRAQLDAEGVGWWDRRGHLKFHHGSVWVDVDVPASDPAPSAGAVDPLAGRVAAGVAVEALIAAPDPLPGVRALARSLPASPGGVSLALSRFVDAGLLTIDRRAAVPGLFWAVAGSWTPAWVDLGAVPSPDDGVAVVGSRAAAALGAPVAVSDDYPLEVLVDGAPALRRLRRRHPFTGSVVPARAAVAPASAATRPDVGGAVLDGHPVAPAVVVALTLAKDPSRAAEILDDWEVAGRVW